MPIHTCWNGKSVDPISPHRLTDGWHFLGISIYVSALWLAALRACQKMAELMNEPDYASKMQEIYDKALEEM